MSDKLVRIKNRYDTYRNWNSANPVLAAGEIGIDSTHNIMKVGNGSSKWNELKPYNSSHYISIASNNSTSVSITMPVSLYKVDDSFPYITNDKFVLTIQVPGYFPSRYMFSGGPIIFSKEDTVKGLDMKIIPITDSNITIDSVPKLTVYQRISYDDMTVTYTVTTIDNNNTDILITDGYDENIPIIADGTLVMTMDRCAWY